MIVEEEIHRVHSLSQRRTRVVRYTAARSRQVEENR